MIISTATKSLCERCNFDMKEKLAYEIYELIAASGLPLICIWINHRFILFKMYKLLQWRDPDNLTLRDGIVEFFNLISYRW